MWGIYGCVLSMAVHCVCLAVCLLVEMRSHYVAQAHLKLIVLWPWLIIVKNEGMCHIQFFPKISSLIINSRIIFILRNTYRNHFNWISFIKEDRNEILLKADNT